MEISETKTGEVLSVALKGRLDAASSGAVEKRLLELIHDGETWIVLDLEQLDYISSIGLRVFMVTAKRLKAAKGGVVVCALKSTIQQVFDISGFGKIFRIFPDRESALADLTRASAAADTDVSPPAVPKTESTSTSESDAAAKDPPAARKKFW